MDLKNVLEDVAALNGWVFSYGNRNNHNLLNNELEANKKYLLVDSPRRTPQINEYGGINGKVYRGMLMILEQSNFDAVYDTQRENDKEDGRYEKHIKPIIETDVIKLIDAITCDTDLSITNFEIIEAINVLDANLDGVIINYVIDER